MVDFNHWLWGMYIIGKYLNFSIPILVTQNPSVVNVWVRLLEDVKYIIMGIT